jgi:hypothetical protein
MRYISVDSSYEGLQVLFTDANNKLYSFDNQKKTIKLIIDGSRKWESDYLDTNKEDQYLSFKSGDQYYLYDYKSQSIHPITLPTIQNVIKQNIEIVSPNHFTMIHEYYGNKVDNFTTLVSISLCKGPQVDSIIGKKKDNEYFDIHNLPLFNSIDGNLWFIDHHSGTKKLV